MKKALLILMMLAMCGVAQAQCVGIPLMNQAKIGKYGEILVPFKYIFNEKEESLLDWITYFPEDLKNMSDTEIISLIENDAIKRCGQIIITKYKENNKDAIVEEREKISEVQIQRIKSLLTNSINKNSEQIVIEKIGTIEVNSDGKKTVSYNIN